MADNIVTIALIVILVTLVVYLAARLSGKCKGGMCSWASSCGSSSNALGILKERFARSEISKEEYEERKKVLTE